MSVSTPLYDAQVMAKCYDVVNAMFVDQGFPVATIRRWWHAPCGNFENPVWGYVAPIDALLDGMGPEVFKEAERYCAHMRSIKGAG